LKKRSPNKAKRKTRRAATQKNVRSPRMVEFPLARGRTVEMVELNLDSDFHCINIRFQDETDLTFVIGTALTFRADHSNWQGGEQKVLKRWPVVRSAGM
jgi:hypothetical protein